MSFIPDKSSLLLGIGMEGNLQEYFVHNLIQGSKNVEVINHKNYLLIDSGLNNSNFNVVVQKEMELIQNEDEIKEAFSYFSSRNLPFNWWVGKDNHSEKLGKILKEQGLRSLGVLKAVAINLSDLTKNFDTPLSLYVETLDNYAKFKNWGEMVGIKLGLRGQYLEEFLERFKNLDFKSNDYNWRKYLGWYNGEPVSASTTILANGVVGVYDTAVLPIYKRGHGLELASAYYPLKDSIKFGYKVGVAFPSVGELNEYRSLGFEERYEFYRYSFIPKRR